MLSKVTQYISWSLFLLAFMLPFELDAALLHIANIAITNVEISVAIVLLCAVIAVKQSGWRWPSRGHLLLGSAIVASLFASALLAPSLNGNALRAALRSLTGIVLAVATLQLLRTRQQLYQLLASLLLGCGISLLLGWYEVESGVALAILNPFRVVPSVAGPFVRLTGSFDYVNQTTMYAEALLPAAILGLALYKRKLNVRYGLLLMCVITLSAGVILSLSRAGWVTAAAIILIGFGWLWLMQREWETSWLVGLAIFTLMFVISVLRYPVFALRLQTETDSAWYVITVEAPEKLRVVAGEDSSVDIIVRNESGRLLSSDTVVPIRIGVRWLDGDVQLAEGRFELQELAMNSAESYTVLIEAPPRAGQFQLQWDLVEENIAWFSDKTEREFLTSVTVLPGAPIEKPSIAFSNPRPRVYGVAPDATRGTLWRTAFAMWRDNPLFGVGLDNFRLLYGERLGQSEWNERLHTNNWYIETLVSLGVAGAVPFFAWLLLLLRDMLRHTARTPDPLVWAIALGILAFYIHGLLDYFLIFNSTGLLFWLLVGAWFAVEKSQKA